MGFNFGKTASWLGKESNASLRRLLPRLEAKYKDQTDPAEWEVYIGRLKRHFPRLFERLHALYGADYDFFYYLESTLSSATEMWLARSPELKALDAMREMDPHWYLSHRMVGAMCYVDLFADDIEGLRKHIPYLSELGITYLHLMPLFKVPQGDNDGGYAISSYREVNPALGSMEALAELASELRDHGISLVLDFVFNHTSDEHDWAKKALAGDEEYQEYYRIFPDRELPDAYEGSMLEVFPDDHPGAFTYSNRMKKWVWTTFNNYQWDLNYENPLVIIECFSPTRASRSCVSMRWPLSGSGWAPIHKISPRRTGSSKPSTPWPASRRRRWYSSPKPSSIPTR